MTGVSWEEALEYLREWSGQPNASLRGLADELEINHGSLSRIISGETETPHLSTRRKISEWVRTHRFGALRPPAGGHYKTTEEELLEYFLKHHEQMAVFMSTTTADLSPADRRKVALAILNGFKRLAIESGERVPPILYELERKFVAETD